MLLLIVLSLSQDRSIDTDASLYMMNVNKIYVLQDPVDINLAVTGGTRTSLRVSTDRYKVNLYSLRSSQSKEVHTFCCLGNKVSVFPLPHRENLDYERGKTGSYYG